ncbi:Uncharacterised protein [Mycobacteroides abscessus subsp. massiliense]|nr:Uncharacterised protein [Mycobacteroides abscessus subsp. massiliense]
MLDDRLTHVRSEVGLVQAQREITQIAQALDEDDARARIQPQPMGDSGRGVHLLDDSHLVTHLAIALEGLLEPKQGIQPVFVLAQCDVGSRAGPPLNEALVLERGERLSHGVT